LNRPVIGNPLPLAEAGPLAWKEAARVDIVGWDIVHRRARGLTDTERFRALGNDAAAKLDPNNSAYSFNTGRARIVPDGFLTRSWNYDVGWTDPVEFPPLVSLCGMDVWLDGHEASLAGLLGLLQALTPAWSIQFQDDLVLFFLLDR
jgi:hypothetical protein